MNHKGAKHPGKHLKALLREPGFDGMSAAGLARLLKVPTNRITGILNGTRNITADSALRLGHYFWNGPQVWIDLQARYELGLAEKAAGPAIRKLRKHNSASTQSQFA